MLLNAQPSLVFDWIEIISQVANVVIAGVAVYLTYHVFSYRSGREKQQQEKDWFHRLVIEPKLDELFGFFSSVEKELNKLSDFLAEGYVPFNEKQGMRAHLGNNFYEFKQNFIEFIEPVDQDLSTELSEQLNRFYENFITKLFSDDLNKEDCITLKKEFQSIKNQTIQKLYHWND